MQSVNECFHKVKNDCFKYIYSQETKTEKFKNKEKMLRSYLIPLSFWIANKKKNKSKTLILGLSGGQGSGKTTIAKKIESHISKKYGPAVNVSGDDLRKLFNFKKEDN